MDRPHGWRSRHRKALGIPSYRERLIGGDGTDRLVGGGGEDLLVAGGVDFVGHTIDLPAVDRLFSAWNSGDPYPARRACVTTVLDGRLVEDDDTDLLTGSAGADLFFANLDGGTTDKITDLKANEGVEEI